MTTLDAPLLPGGIPAFGEIDFTAFPVRIRNAGPFPLTWRYDGKTYAIPADPDRESMVPYMAMVRHMGDPRSVDIDNRRRHRHNEYMRLRALYGVYEHDELWRTATKECACSKNDGGDFSKCSGHLPSVTAFNFEGEQIITVLDDPEGTSVNAAPAQTMAEEAMLRDMVMKQSAQLQTMSAQLLALQNEREAQVQGDPVELGEQGTTERTVGPEAEPTPPPSPSAKTPARVKGQGAATVTKDDA